MQVELRGSDRELTNGHIYEISGFDMHVVVKYQQSSSETGTCSCPPAVCLLMRDAIQARYWRSQFWLSVSPFVSLSDTCTATKRKNLLPIFRYYTTDQSLWYSDINNGWRKKSSFNI